MREPTTNRERERESTGEKLYFSQECVCKTPVRKSSRRIGETRSGENTKTEMRRAQTSCDIAGLIRARGRFYFVIIYF